MQKWVVMPANPNAIAKSSVWTEPKERAKVMQVINWKINLDSHNGELANINIIN